MLTAKEQREYGRLIRKWALRKATVREMRRCLQLGRKAAVWARMSGEAK